MEERKSVQKLESMKEQFMESIEFSKKRIKSYEKMISVLQEAIDALKMGSLKDCPQKEKDQS